MTWQVIEGDCVEQMQAMPECSVDAVVCDPPYMLGFMGKAWDTLTPGQIQHGHDRWSAEAFRVLKPGGHLLAFGGTRTYHRLACAVEDAGFEIRDTIAWMYGSGFPKSLDVSKQIDGLHMTGGAGSAAWKHANLNRPGEATVRKDSNNRTGQWAGGVWEDTGPSEKRSMCATPDAERWQGWGTALKPAHEPIVVARKPLSGTVAANVLEHGTGALNVDGCRIGTEVETWPKTRSYPLKGQPVSTAEDESSTNGTAPSLSSLDDRTYGSQGAPTEPTGDAPPGRWPANVVMDPDAAALVPESRFFYCAKSSSAERNAGLDGFEAREVFKGNHADNPVCQSCGGSKIDRGSGECSCAAPDWRVNDRAKQNSHPTVKPIELMRWLVRLVTPPGGLVLDPFAGSGTTGCAAMLEGFRFIGIERESEYAAIARARIAWWAEHPDGMQLVERLEAERERKAIADSGQLGLFGEAA